jgi:predicted nucleic acid-binding protein
LSVYVDSSFLVSLYLQDSHLRKARKCLVHKPEILLTPLNRAELAHSFYFQVFRQRIRVVEAQLAWVAFENDCSKHIWREVPLPPEIWSHSANLAAKYGAALGIRTLDSLHVACALELKADKFWTFDERQEKLAKAVGLDTTA